MAKSPVKTQMPGEDPVEKDDLPTPRQGTTELNNIAGTTANDVGLDRENVVRAQALADAARRGVQADLAPAADIGKPAEPTAMKKKAMIGGVMVDVEMPIQRRNSVVDQFGPESKLPPGTLVNKDGTAFDGTGDAYGVVGHIDTAQGKLVNRVIPFDAVKEGKAA
jgi:hypothetical protein